MKRRYLWIAFGLLLAGIMAFAPLGTAVAATAAAPVENSFQNIPVSSSDGAFTGEFDITHFSVDNGRLLAHGKLSGTLIQNGVAKEVKNRGLAWPVESINGQSVNVGAASAATRSAFAAQQQPACTVLSLVLGPLDLNLLGLRVQLNQVNLLITAIPGGGLLGDLLCAVANLLSGLNLNGLLQIANLLNQILAIVNQL